MSKVTPSEHDALIQAGGKPLEDALKESLMTAEGTAAPAPAEETKAEPEPEAEEEAEEKVEPKGEAKPEAEADAPEEEDGSSGKPKTKVGKKIEKLLHQRNSERLRAEQAEERARVAEAKLAERKKDGDGEEEAPEEEKSPVSEVDDLDAKIDERLALKESQRRLSEADVQERKSLLSKYPEAKNFLEEIDEVLKVHPTLSDEAAYRLANPSDFVKSKEDARKHESGGRTPSRLKSDSIDPKKLSKADLERHLMAGIADGSIVP